MYYYLIIGLLSTIGATIGVIDIYLSKLDPGSSVLPLVVCTVALVLIGLLSIKKEFNNFIPSPVS
jgi:hypothetical protein